MLFCRLRIAILLCLLIPTAGAAQNERPQNAVKLTTLEGRTIAGRLGRITDGRIMLEGTAKQTIAVEDALRMDAANRAGQPPSSGSVIFLANGDRLAAHVERMDDESFTCRFLQLAGRPTLKVPLETVRGLIPMLPRGDSSRRLLTNTVFDGGDEADRLLLQNGDEVTGELTSLDDATFTLESTAGPKQIERTSVRAVTMNAALISFPPLAPRYALVMLTDGSRLTAESVEIHGDVMTCTLPFGAKLEVALSDLVSLQFFSENVTPLSQLEPVDYQYTPYLSGRWPLRRDRSVAGGPLLIDGREYGTGLGTHSRCRIEYDLAGNFRQFRAVVGIDDAAGDKGSAVAAVFVDGEQVYDSGQLTGTLGPKPVGPIDVAGAKTLTLVVEFGEYGDVRDHVDWCDALLIR